MNLMIRPQPSIVAVEKNPIYIREIFLQYHLQSYLYMPAAIPHWSAIAKI